MFLKPALPPPWLSLENRSSEKEWESSLSTVPFIFKYKKSHPGSIHVGRCFSSRCSECPSHRRIASHLSWKQKNLVFLKVQLSVYLWLKLDTILLSSQYLCPNIECSNRRCISLFSVTRSAPRNCYWYLCIIFLSWINHFFPYLYYIYHCYTTWCVLHFN